MEQKTPFTIDLKTPGFESFNNDTVRKYEKGEDLILNPLPFLSLLPDQVKEHIITIERKCDMLVNGNCELNADEFLMLNRSNGTLELVSMAEISYTPVNIEDCQFKTALSEAHTPIRIPFEKEDYNALSQLSGKYEVPNRFFESVPDVMVGKTLLDHHKQTFLTRGELDLGHFGTLRLDTNTGLINLIDNIEHWHLIRNKDCSFGVKYEREMDLPGTKPIELNIYNLPVETLFIRMNLYHYDQPYSHDVTKEFHQIPDIIRGQQILPEHKASIFLNGYALLENNSILEYDPHRNRFIHVFEKQDNPGVWVKNTIQQDECTFKKVSVDQENMPLRFPVEDNDYKLAIFLNNFNNLNKNPYEQFKSTPVIDQFPDSIYSVPFSKDQKVEVLINDTGITIEGRNFKMDKWNGMLTVQKDPLERTATGHVITKIPTYKDCELKSLQKQQELPTPQEKKNKNNQKDQGMSM